MSIKLVGFSDAGEQVVLPLVVDRYPDKTPLIQSPALDPVNTLLVQTTSVSELMSALFFVDALDERGAKSLLTLVLPYVPGARQDRLNSSGDYLFMVKSIAKEINARKFDEVVVLDPHSDVTPALIDRCRVVSAADCINPPPGKYHAVIAPDGGAEKRAAKVAQKLGVPLIHAWKTRDVKTGKLSGFGWDSFGGMIVTTGTQKNALLVDDICDGGGTFIGLAQEIRKTVVPAQLRLDLYTTHGLYTKGTDELFKWFSHIYCTDSISAARPGVIEVAVCEKLAREGHL